MSDKDTADDEEASPSTSSNSVGGSLHPGISGRNNLKCSQKKAKVPSPPLSFSGLGNNTGLRFFLTRLPLEIHKFTN